MFRLTGIRHVYPQGQAIAFPDWHAVQGEEWLLTGASGSGKTTLLHMLAGLRRPTQGRTEVAGTDLYALPGGHADAFRGRHIGLVLQRPHLLGTLGVEENLQLAQYLAGLPADTARISEVLGLLGLAQHRRTLPHRLSQGQAQRAAIARAVLNRPRLLLADEPTASLDDANATAVLDLLQAQARACGATLVVATHDARVRNRLAKQYHLAGTNTGADAV